MERFVKLLVYGTLRKDQYNYLKIKELFGESSIRFIEELPIGGFDLFDKWDYPVAIPGRGVLICEMMEVSEAADRFIEIMERTADYAPSYCFGAKIYTYKGPLWKLKEIDSGNWLKRESTDRN